MKLKKETDYALRIVFYLSSIYLESSNKITDSKTISKAENIPEFFCLKILKKLKQADIVNIYRGVNGGYLLNKNPSQISLGKIIHIIENNNSISDCICEPDSCSNNRGSYCPVRISLSLIQNEFFKSMEKISFYDILNANFFKILK